MALHLVLDPAIRLILEPGYRQSFPVEQVARNAQPADTTSARQLWHLPGMGAIMLKPLQLQPDFLNHAAQLSNNCVLRLSTDYSTLPADIAAQTIFEAAVGTTDNPWIFHAPATPMTLGPTLPPVGPEPFHNLVDVADSSESGSGTLWTASPGEARKPGDIQITGGTDSQCRMLVNTPLFRANQGFLFRWHFPDPKLTPHQTIYGFVFAQYMLYCRETLLEVYRDVSPGGDRSLWNREYSVQNFFSTSGALPSPTNPNWPFGQQTIGESGSVDKSVLVIPYHRSRVMLISSNGASTYLTVRNQPQLLPDGSDYDITRSGSIEVWALTGCSGRFQVQIVKYEPGPAVLNLPPAITEYTPLTTPVLIPSSDVFYDEELLAAIVTPPGYTFPQSPISNDTPPPTQDGTGQSRTYGMTLTFASTINQTFSPQYYGMEVVALPVFMDNPATPHTILDVAGDSLIMSAEVSLGSEPGDGTLMAHVQDIGPSYPLTPYYLRSEMPVQLQLNGTSIFTGYSDRNEVRPLRETGAPVDFTIRARDRWLLLETSILRDQRDWTGVGHITVVDFIAQQCGIDTVAQPAEYPAGWDSTLADVYNTPLATPVTSADNLESGSLLGWKPQIRETGATFLNRIREVFSGWVMGFRGDGTFYYLPYDYFTTPSATFHANAASGSPVYRNPVELKVIEPSGNIVQVVSKYTVDQTANKSGLFVDGASVSNPAAANYLGRYKWQLVEIEGSFTPPQLNAMAYIVFRSSRRRRKRLSIDADFMPALKIGQVFTVEGYGDYRMIDFKARIVKSNWETVRITGESTEAGF